MSEGNKLTPFVADILRWTAKVWSLAALGLLLVIFVGELISPTTAEGFTQSELVGLLFFPIGTCLGMVLAWRRELLGGAVTLASMVAFYIWMYLDRAFFPRGPYFLLIAAPGVLFSLAGLLSPSARAQPDSPAGQ